MSVDLEHGLLLRIDTATHIGRCVERHVIHYGWTPLESSPGTHSRRAVVKARVGNLAKMVDGSLGDLASSAFEIVVG